MQRTAYWLSKHTLNACIKETTQYHEGLSKYLQTRWWDNNRLQGLLCGILSARLSELLGKPGDDRACMNTGVLCVSRQLVFCLHSFKQWGARHIFACVLQSACGVLGSAQLLRQKMPLRRQPWWKKRKKKKTTAAGPQGVKWTAGILRFCIGYCPDAVLLDSASLCVGLCDGGV